MFCSNCGKEIDDKAVVCIHCGVATQNFNQARTTKKEVDLTLKSRLAAGLLAIFIGGLGIHNFYLGFKKKAMTQLLLSVVGWIVIVGPIIASIWGLIDGIMILTNSINEDADGRPLRD